MIVDARARDRQHHYSSNLTPLCLVSATVENLLKYLNESHRMIVILTDAYVDERWTRFEAQQVSYGKIGNQT